MGTEPPCPADKALLPGARRATDGINADGGLPQFARPRSGDQRRDRLLRRRRPWLTSRNVPPAPQVQALRTYLHAVALAKAGPYPSVPVAPTTGVRPATSCRGVTQHAVLRTASLRSLSNPSLSCRRLRQGAKLPPLRSEKPRTVCERGCTWKNFT